MNNVHFAIPEIYGETLSYYELLRKLVNKTNELIENYNTVPEQIAEAVSNLDASQLFSAVLNQLIHSIATDNTKSAYAVKVYKKHDLLYATFNDTVNLYESLIDFSMGTETELIPGTNIREVNISELFIELRKLIDINKNNIESVRAEANEKIEAVKAVANENSASITTIHGDITAIENKNTEQDNELSTLRTMISSPYNFKGDVANISALPARGEVNDTYYVQDVKYKVTWTGSAWVQSSLSEADYQTELSEVKSDLEELENVTQFFYNGNYEKAFIDADTGIKTPNSYFAMISTPIDTTKEKIIEIITNLQYSSLFVSYYEGSSFLKNVDIDGKIIPIPENVDKVYVQFRLPDSSFTTNLLKSSIKIIRYSVYYEKKWDYVGNNPDSVVYDKTFLCGYYDSSTGLWNDFNRTFYTTSDSIDTSIRKHIKLSTEINYKSIFISCFKQDGTFLKNVENLPTEFDVEKDVAYIYLTFYMKNTDDRLDELNKKTFIVSSLNKNTYITSNEVKVLGNNLDYIYHTAITKGTCVYDSEKLESGRIFWDSKELKYGMVYVGYGTDEHGNHGSIMLAWSDDLETWEVDGVILLPSFVSGTPDYGSVTGCEMYMEDGMYYLYYIGCEATGYENGDKNICLAYGTDIHNLTRYSGNPVVRKDTTKWYGGDVYRPNIVKWNDGLYYMFFNARSTDTGWCERIGYSYSYDLLNWSDGDVLLSNPTTQSLRVIGDPYLYDIGDDNIYMAFFMATGTWNTTSDGIAMTSKKDFPLKWKIAKTEITPNGKGKPCIVYRNGKQYHFVGNETTEIGYYLAK